MSFWIVQLQSRGGDLLTWATLAGGGAALQVGTAGVYRRIARLVPALATVTAFSRWAERESGGHASLAREMRVR